ncbi:MAG: response regulator transcription factor, partial [Pseudomonadota bacterium]
HDLVRETLVAFFQSGGEFSVTEAKDLETAVALLESEDKFDLILLDYDMPGMNGLTGLERAVSMADGIPVAIVSGAADASIAKRALEAGAIGFLPKTMSSGSLNSAIKLMAAGERFAPLDFLASAGNEHPLAEKLTSREKEVLSGLCRGLSNKEIARETDLQEVTIKLHVKTLCRKLEARNRTHAAMIAKDAGLF